MRTKIHIGKIIESHLKSKNMSARELADKICCSTRNVYKILDKESVDTSQLQRISNTLNHNFFTYFLNDGDFENIKQ